jgi:hypothetical protein
VLYSPWLFTDEEILLDVVLSGLIGAASVGTGAAAREPFRRAAATPAARCQQVTSSVTA